ncbi:MAG: T9SS type A sorting domain-containing protein, partial [candidate division KSB1 bacterium]|nr:T9SS type A sorting domain-containing protein [candidate division KSB1 bacterium]
AVKNSPAAPGSYALAQNYPNPLQISSLNPVTTIEFELTKPGHVLVTLYDINGHEVSKLIDREMADSIRWPVAASRHLFLSTQNRRFQRHKKDDPG